ncbi:GAF domain-containing protein [Egicoccus halophilus]|uniref:histidine kinase n=1 Tax=Egicoccus halophilus TaxID=1670830 RepID=A0A8J3A7Y1_9ACTN|nr:GAF domain-containing protein [Egicoccus halophilus]GGI03477.1 hypothetical protein GCM10011354_04240 [Egicoccus halophilus]
MLTAVLLAAAVAIVVLVPPLERRRRTALRGRRAAERRVELLETARTLPGRDLADAARVACRGLRSLGFDAAAVVERRGETIVPLHLDGLPGEGTTIPAAGSLAGRCIAERRTLVVADYTNQPLRRPERPDVGSVVLTPIPEDDRAACLLAVRRTVGAADDEDVEVVEAVAAHLGHVFATEATVRTQQQLLDRMRRLEDMRSGFVAEVSEELRDPLTVVRGIAQTLASRGEDLPGDQRVALLAGLGRQATQLGDTIDALLDFSRFQAARREPVLAPVRLHELLTPLAGERLAWAHPTLPGRAVRVDAELVRHALDLLLSTAPERALEVTTVGPAAVAVAVSGRPPSRGAPEARGIPEGLATSLAGQLVLAAGGRLRSAVARSVELPLDGQDGAR